MFQEKKKEKKSIPSSLLLSLEQLQDALLPHPPRISEGTWVVASPSAAGRGAEVLGGGVGGLPVSREEDASFALMPSFAFTARLRCF